MEGRLEETDKNHGGNLSPWIILRNRQPSDIPKQRFCPHVYEGECMCKSEASVEII